MSVRVDTDSMSETGIRHGRSSVRRASDSDSKAYFDARYTLNALLMAIGPDRDLVDPQLRRDHEEVAAGDLGVSRSEL